MKRIATLYLLLAAILGVLGCRPTAPVAALSDDAGDAQLALDAVADDALDEGGEASAPLWLPEDAGVEPTVPEASAPTVPPAKRPGHPVLASEFSYISPPGDAGTVPISNGQGTLATWGPVALTSVSGVPAGSPGQVLVTNDSTQSAWSMGTAAAGSNPTSIALSPDLANGSCTGSGPCTPGSVVINVGAPGATGSPQEAGVILNRGGLFQGFIGTVPGYAGAYTGLWFSPSFTYSTLNTANYTLIAGSSATFVNGQSNLYLAAAATPVVGVNASGTYAYTDVTYVNGTSTNRWLNAAIQQGVNAGTAKTNGTTPSNFTITPEVPNAGASTTATETPGSLVVALAQPISGGNEPFLEITRNSSPIFWMGADPGSSGGIAGLWGPVSTPTISNFFFLSDGSATNYLNAPTTLNFRIGGSNTYFSLNGSTATFTATPVPNADNSVQLGASTLRWTTVYAVGGVNGATVSGTGSDMGIVAQGTSGASANAGNLILTGGSVAGTGHPGSIKFGWGSTSTFIAAIGNQVSSDGEFFLGSTSGITPNSTNYALQSDGTNLFLNSIGSSGLVEMSANGAAAYWQGTPLTMTWLPTATSNNTVSVVPTNTITHYNYEANIASASATSIGTMAVPSGHTIGLVAKCTGRLASISTYSSYISAACGVSNVAGTLTITSTTALVTVPVSGPVFSCGSGTSSPFTMTITDSNSSSTNWMCDIEVQTN